MLHDDTVGALYLPKGHYRITLLRLAALQAAWRPRTCSASSSRTGDGKLRSPWDRQRARIQLHQGPRRQRLQRHPGRAPAAAAAAEAATTRTGRSARAPTACSTTTTSARFRIPKGTYAITLLSVGRDHLPAVLAGHPIRNSSSDYHGILPAPWFIDTETGSFMRGGRNTGSASRNWPARRVRTAAAAASTRTAGCRPGTFDVLDNDSVGKLPAAQGPVHRDPRQPGDPVQPRTRSCSRLP